MPVYPSQIETYTLGSYWNDISGSTSADAVAAVSGVIRDGYVYETTSLTGDGTWGTDTPLSVHIPSHEIRRIVTKISS